MTYIETALSGVVELRPKVFGDERGYFFESFVEADFRRNVADIRFVQDNESRSAHGVVRGLHFQTGSSAQAKLVRVVSGKVRDVAVDLRHGSPTFGRYVAVDLDDESHNQIFLPRGFAHGFAVLSESAVVQYKCDNYYDPSAEGGIAWNDPALAIDWGIDPSEVILSAKDICRPTLTEFVAGWDPANPVF